MPDFIELVCLGGQPLLLLSTMDGQLEAVRQDICDVKGNIAKIEQNLAAAEQPRNGDQENIHLQLLLTLNTQLSSLQEKENILLRSQAPSKPCLQLVHTGLPVFTPFCVPFSA